MRKSLIEPCHSIICFFPHIHGVHLKIKKWGWKRVCGIVQLLTQVNVACLPAQNGLEHLELDFPGTGGLCKENGRDEPKIKGVDTIPVPVSAAIRTCRACISGKSKDLFSCRPFLASCL